jgi:hypothetical protein
MTDTLAAAQPHALDVFATGIPAELISLPQWVVWEWRLIHDTGRWTKVPINPRAGIFEGKTKRAKSNDPSTWAGFGVAHALHTSCPERIAGVGFVFTADDDYCGIDLDGCRDPETGVIADWAMETVRAVGSYTEASPSGKGLKIIAKATLPLGQGRKHGPREVYDRARYFTITGRTLTGYSRIEPRQDAVAAFYSNPAFFPPKAPSKPADAVQRAASPVSAQDADIVARVKANAKGAKLWAGDLSDYKSDHSSADLALAGMLAYYCGPDSEERVDRLFRSSALMRDKWDRDDYRERTLGMVSALDSYYSWPAFTDAEFRDLWEKGRVSAPKTMIRVTEFADDSLNVPSTPAPKVRTKRKTVLTIQDVKTMPKTNWLIKDHIPEGGLAALVGPSGCGKSFKALDYSLCVATGKPYLGVYDVACGPVLYICSEGIGGMKNRIAAWFSHYGTPEPDNVGFVPSAFDFMNTDETFKHLDKIAQVDFGMKPSLVVVDTLARNFRGEENSAKEIGAFVKTCNLLQERWRTTVLVVHHTGKDPGKRERGSTAFRGALDTLIAVDATRVESAMLVTMDKQKDAEPLKAYEIRKTKVDLGDGQSSLIFTSVDALSTAFNFQSLERKDKLAEIAQRFPSGPFSTQQLIDAGIWSRASAYRIVKELSRDKVFLPEGEGHVINPALKCF